MIHRTQSRLWAILTVANPGDRASRAFDLALLFLILGNVFAFTLSSVPSIQKSIGTALWWFEFFSVIVFTIEYVLRIFSCTIDDRFRHPVLGRIKFALTPLAIIDLLAILPFYLPMVGIDLRVLRLFRLMRLMRILKLGRYSESLRLIGRVVAKKREELTATLFIGLVLLVVAASLIYVAEGEEQPVLFGSIPKCMWWAVTTLTTVGYGDTYPVTLMGKLLGSAVAILGIGMFALPTGILGSAFLEELDARKKGSSDRVCPQCGHSWDGA